MCLFCNRKHYTKSEIISIVGEALQADSDNGKISIYPSSGKIWIHELRYSLNNRKLDALLNYLKLRIVEEELTVVKTKSA